MIYQQHPVTSLSSTSLKMYELATIVLENTCLTIVNVWHIYCQQKGNLAKPMSSQTMNLLHKAL